MTELSTKPEALLQDAAAPAALSVRPAFRTLFENEFAYVCRTLQRFGVPQSDVADVAHDVFVAVHARLAEYDPARPIRPWLFAFAVRLAAKYRERAYRFGPTADEMLIGEMVDATPMADDQMAAAQARALVLSALRSIDEQRREVFVLHELDEQPMPEVARALGLPLNTAYSRLRVAREEFRAAVTRLKRADAARAGDQS